MIDSSQPAATLTVSRGPGAGRRFDIGTVRVTLGRHEQCEIQVQDTWVSRQHARIVWSGSGYVVEDLGSTNGTFVNGERVAGSRGLKSGDILRLGEEVELAFQVSAPAPRQEERVLPDTGEPYPEPVRAGEEPAPRRRRTWALVALGILLVVIIGGGAYYLLSSRDKGAARPDLPHAVIGEELVLGDTKFLVTGAKTREGIEVDMGFGPTELTLNEPGMIFLEVKMVVSNLRDENAVLEGDEGANSIFALVGGDGERYGTFGYMSDPAVAANETRNLTKTFVIHRDAVEGAELYVKDIFSDQMGIILLSE